MNAQCINPLLPIVLEVRVSDEVPNEGSEEVQDEVQKGVCIDAFAMCCYLVNQPSLILDCISILESIVSRCTLHLGVFQAPHIGHGTSGRSYLGVLGIPCIAHSLEGVR